MTQKLFLTSAVAMGFMLPAIAEPSHTGTFPSTGLMEADYTYTNAATETNMGVYEGSVDAEAQYEDVLYQIAAGEYLPAGTETVINCNQSGYFCPGVSGGVNYDETNDQGLTSCSTATNGDYTLSDGTGSSINTCYRTCTNNDVEHSTGTMNGGYYYGNNNQCEPTACVNGWHLKAGVPDLATAIGTGAGENSAHINNNGKFKEVNYDGQGAKGQSYYGLTDNNTWAVDYGANGMLVGQGRCSTVEGVRDFNYSTNQLNQPITTHTTSELGAEGGRYCYCNVTGYTPDGGTLQAVLSPWLFNIAYSGGGSASNCASYCADNCADSMRHVDSYSLAFRAALAGSVTGFQPGLAMCEANVITINWGDTDLADVTANEAGTATYGEDIRTPVKAQTKAGKRFTGWRFSAPQQTTLP